MKTAGCVTLPLILGLALTAATASTSLAAPAPSRNGVAGVLRSVTLTNADNGHAVTVRAGDDIRVRLTGGPAQGGTWAWSVPVAGDPAALHRNQGATAPNGDATAVFRAVKTGRSDITSTGRCVPKPGSQCPSAVRQWKVTIEVQ
ncbi:hypothetical protein [Streptomyces sp. NPDC007172]|uniref:hypothetical protein n=1 Tax=Streptomyces sp. NPDC007172 TaxID=3364776 RepID=UPI00369F1C60